MTITIKLGATQSGGTDTTLTDSGSVGPGSRVFAFPSSTRLLPRTAKFFSNIPATTDSNPGVVRAGVRLILGNRVQDESCCTVTPGSVIVNLDISWPLNQPDTLVDEAIDQLRAIAFSQTLADLVKKGMIPV